MPELTPRQSQVLTLLARGLSTKEIARTINNSPRTVEVFIRQAKVRLSGRNITHTVAIAIILGLIDISQMETCLGGGPPDEGEKAEPARNESGNGFLPPN